MKGGSWIRRYKRLDSKLVFLDNPYFNMHLRADHGWLTVDFWYWVVHAAKSQPVTQDDEYCGVILLRTYSLLLTRGNIDTREHGFR